MRFYCQHCGREGHRKFYCPELKNSSTASGFRCRLCGEKGHNKRTCPKSRLTNQNGKLTRHHSCGVCHQRGHNRRTCPRVIGVKLPDADAKDGKSTYETRRCTCRLCGGKGHNARTCPTRNIEAEVKLKH